ncbi:MAG TPA: OsmC family protein [Pseudorhodoplanes sp.]|jgi:organic hydroperoxide reductase OsmC/OhrA|nr:OsmC family protein [Pseudorhodoplanes sp.]
MSGGRHLYRASIAWSDPGGTVRASTHTRDHVIRIPGKPDILASSDPAFRGDPARHNPEDLLVASLSSCHMLWYLSLCAKAGIVVSHYDDEAEGVMIEDRATGGRFESVTLRPRVRIATGDPAQARALHHEAHRLCFIANSVNFPVACEPTILTQ